jgi:anti-sigma28 factor (negative regulator of flagellin synthesis)
MSVTDHSSAANGALRQTTSDSNSPCNEAGETALRASGKPDRLQAIHELVRSGDYSIPASAIADRMIERLIVDKRGHGS